MKPYPLVLRADFIFSIASNPRKLNISSNAYAPSRPSYGHPGEKRVHGSTSSAPSSTHNNHHFGKRMHHIAPKPYHGMHKASQSRKGISFSQLQYYFSFLRFCLFKSFDNFLFLSVQGLI